MYKVWEIEDQIWELESFYVHFIHQGSRRRLHANWEGLPEYPHELPAPDNMTANRWRRLRFNPAYPDYAVRVLLGDGKPARGPERLYTIRRSY